MPMATIEGIPTYFETYGSGPPLLMCALGGFDADIKKWRTQGIYSHIKFLEHLPQHFDAQFLYRLAQDVEVGARGLDERRMMRKEPSPTIRLLRRFKAGENRIELGKKLL